MYEYMNVCMMVCMYVFMCVRLYEYIYVCAVYMCICIFSMYTAVSKKVAIINSQYWNRKELWGSSSTRNLLLKALT